MMCLKWLAVFFGLTDGELRTVQMADVMKVKEVEGPEDIMSWLESTFSFLLCRVWEIVCGHAAKATRTMLLCQFLCSGTKQRYVSYTVAH